MTAMNIPAPLGLIAGNRELPLMVMNKAGELGRPVAVLAIEGEADPVLEKQAARFAWVKLGQLQPIIDFFKGAGVRDLLMIGGVSREAVVNYEPDAAAIEVMESIDDFHTDKILRAVAARLEREGLILGAVPDLLPELLTAPGILGAEKPTADLLADLKVAWRVAKELGRLDVGQCAVVSDRITLAVEAAEGTDETVKRGAALAAKPAAVAKVVKPGQDLRLDPPVIGPESIRVMARAGVGALVVDALSILIINRAECVRLADAAGLALLAWDDRTAAE